MSRQRLFAVAHLFGRQHIVTAGDLLDIQGHLPLKCGQKLLLDKCVLMGNKDITLVGRPILSKDLFRIEATVVEKTMSDTRLFFRHRPRRRGWKKYFFQALPRTVIRINEIELKKIPESVEALND